MYFDNLQQALVMDGHGAFVWAAYTITLVILVALVVAPRRRERHLRRQLAAVQRRERAARPGPEEE